MFDYALDRARCLFPQAPPKTNGTGLFPFLPELPDDRIARQMQEVRISGVSPCLEFPAEESSLVSNNNTVRFPGAAASYDDRYRTMWTLPMSACTDASDDWLHLRQPSLPDKFSSTDANDNWPHWSQPGAGRGQ